MHCHVEKLLHQARAGAVANSQATAAAKAQAIMEAKFKAQKAESDLENREAKLEAEKTRVEEGRPKLKRRGLRLHVSSAGKGHTMWSCCHAYMASFATNAWRSVGLALLVLATSVPDAGPPPEHNSLPAVTWTVIQC